MLKELVYMRLQVGKSGARAKSSHPRANEGRGGGCVRGEGEDGDGCCWAGTDD